jgi:hypothetical protein
MGILGRIVWHSRELSIIFCRTQIRLISAANVLGREPVLPSKRIRAELQPKLWRHDVRIINKTKSLLIVTLNSGISLHLGPGQISEPFDEMEMAGNEKFEKLLKTGVLSLVQMSAL